MAEDTIHKEMRNLRHTGSKEKSTIFVNVLMIVQKTIFRRWGQASPLTVFLVVNYFSRSLRVIWRNLACIFSCFAKVLWRWTPQPNRSRRYDFIAFRRFGMSMVMDRVWRRSGQSVPKVVAVLLDPFLAGSIKCEITA